jgi:multiple sugar transport system substrate-binding protein
VKLFVAATLALLIALSFVARATRPRPVDPTKIQLIWSSDDNPRRGPQIDPFNTLHPELHLQLDPNNTETEKVVVQSLGGIGPDLFDCYNGSSLSAFVKAGIAWDVTDELKGMGIDVQRETWTAGQRCCVVEGRVYGFPGNAAVNALWFHKDICRDAGVEIPNRSVDLGAGAADPSEAHRARRAGQDHALRAAARLEQQLPPVHLPVGRADVHAGRDALHPRFAAVHRGGHVHAGPDLQVQGAAQRLRRRRRSTRRAGTGSAGSGAITLFGARRGATALGGRWWLCALREPDYAGLKLGAVEAPYGQVRTFAGYGKATLVNKNGPHRREALQWLVYLHSEAVQPSDQPPGGRRRAGHEVHADDSFLHDPDYPDEDYNGCLARHAAHRRSRADQPVHERRGVQRLIDMQLELVKSGDKSAADAMRDATRQVNQRIQENLRQSPALREQWERLTKGQS